MNSDLQPLLAGPVLPRRAVVLARELVDLLLRAVGRHLGAAVDREPAVHVGRIDDGERDALVVLEMVRLGATRGGVERRQTAVDVHPDDGVVRRAVRAERRHDAREGVLQERELAVRHDCSAVGMSVSLPSLICFAIASTCRTYAFGSCGLTLPIPTPLFARLKTALPPPWNLCASTCWIVA